MVYVLISSGNSNNETRILPGYSWSNHSWLCILTIRANREHECAQINSYEFIRVSVCALRTLTVR